MSRWNNRIMVALFALFVMAGTARAQTDICDFTQVPSGNITDTMCAAFHDDGTAGYHATGADILKYVSSGLTIGDFSDVNTTGVATGDLLYYSGGTEFVPLDIGEVAEQAAISAGGSGINISTGTVTFTGSNSVAIGSDITVAGTEGVAIGHLSESGTQGTAIGVRADATGQTSVAVGRLAIAQGENTIAIGVSAGALNATGSTAIGRSAGVNNSTDATAVGRSSNASGDEAVALGYNSTANQNNSVAIGANVTTTAANQIMLGTASEDTTILGTLSVSGKAKTPSPYTADKTGAYTITADDVGGIIAYNSSGGATFTIPDGLSINNGDLIGVRQIGAGAVTFASSGSMVVTSKNGLSTNGLGALATISFRSATQTYIDGNVE